MNLKTTFIFKHLFIRMFLIYWMFSILLLLLTSRGEVLLWLNSQSVTTLDWLFLHTAWMGHGTFGFLLVVLFFVFYRLSSGLQLGITLVLVSLFTNFAKRMLFFQHNRPLWIFDYDDLTRVITDIPLNYMRSFPSGHAMTAFGIAATISFLVNRNWVTYTMFFYALWVSVSRIYLCQHFYVDVVWGSVLGCISACLAVFILKKLLVFDTRLVLNRSALAHLYRFYSIQMKKQK